MIHARNFEFIRPNRSLRELKLLSHIETNPDTSQRELGKQASLTAAMVNQYILEFAAKGYIEVEGETNRTLRYRITGSGQSRRNELRKRYAEELGVLHGAIREHYRHMLSDMFGNDLRRAAVLGANDKAELVCRAAEEAGVEIAGVYDSTGSGKVHRHSVRPVTEMDPRDAVIDCLDEGIRPMPPVRRNDQAA